MKQLFIISILLLLSSCGFNEGCCAAEKPATEFMNALKKGNFTLAKSYCNKNASNFIDSCLKSYQKNPITEVSNVICDVKGNLAVCTSCCMKDSIMPRFIMRVLEKNRNNCNNWKVVDILLEKY